MNVCVLKESLVIGGTERSAANISKALQGDHAVYLALYDATQIKYSYGGQLMDLQAPPRPTPFGKVYNTFLREVRLRRLLKEKRIQILFTFTGITNRQTHHRYSAVKIISARDFGRMREKHRQFRKALQQSDAMICNSEYIKAYYLSLYPDDAHKVYAVYNYINTAEICKQAEEPVEAAYGQFLSKHTSTLVSAGRFCREKGFEYLIEAFSQARQTQKDIGLVLIGDGEYRQKYMDRITHLGLQEHVYFTGFQKNPYKYMAKCSCFVLSSLSEGFPNVLAEAMALKLPVIAANCLSGPAEILRNDGDYDAAAQQYIACDYGILTPRITEENNEQAVCQLSEAICVMLSDVDMRARYAALAEQRAGDFSEAAVKKKLNLIFDELIKRKAKT